MASSVTATRRLAGMCALVLAWLCGCGAKVAPPIFEEEDDPRALEAGREADGEASEPVPPPGPTADRRDPRPGTPRPLAPPGPGLRRGEIERATLLRTLDAGPGSLLRTVEVSPFFDGSRFVGWRLDQIVDAASPLAAADLRSGDIVLAINQRPIARPEHVMAIWQDLRAADELVCQVWRGQAAFELRFAITPKASPQTTPPPPVPAPTPVSTTRATR